MWEFGSNSEYFEHNEFKLQCNVFIYWNNSFVQFLFHHALRSQLIFNWTKYISVNSFTPFLCSLLKREKRRGETGEGEERRVLEERGERSHSHTSGILPAASGSCTFWIGGGLVWWAKLICTAVATLSCVSSMSQSQFPLRTMLLFSQGLL